MYLTPVCFPHVCPEVQQTSHLVHLYSFLSPSVAFPIEQSVRMSGMIPLILSALPLRASVQNKLQTRQ